MSMKKEAKSLFVPLDAPEAVREGYLNNLRTITRGTGRLMLFAGDQKVEHLNDDFAGPSIHPDDGNPEHLFKIASEGAISFLEGRWVLSHVLSHDMALHTHRFPIL